MFPEEGSCRERACPFRNERKNTMYLHLGSGAVIRRSDIIGIFDLDNTSQSHITRKYLAAAEKNGQVINVAEDIPKSFVIGNDGKNTKVYLSQMATQTLYKR